MQKDLRLPPAEPLPTRPNLPRVLVADDDAVSRIILQSLLQQWGYGTESVSDGAQAWEILEREDPPKLVIVDWTMPSLDGLEICRRLRAEERAFYPWVLMITARDQKQDIRCALEAGADDCLVKPFDEAELRARLSVARRMIRMQDDLIYAREQLRVQATKDALTELLNYGAFLDMFGSELKRAARTGSDTGLLLLDLDHFKNVNDTHGHTAGNEVLVEVARRLKRRVRSYDFVARYGGEEFCIVFPDCPEHQLCERAEAIRRAVADDPVHTEGADIPVTISIGAAVASPDRASATAILERADTALYQAKKSGRNRTAVCDQKGRCRVWTSRL